MGLRQDLYRAVYTALDAAELMGGDATVTSAYPDTNPTFPLVVINPVDVGKEGYTFDRSYATKNIRLMIDIWTTKNYQKDQIADEIEAIAPSTLVGSTGVSVVGWTESNALEPEGGNKIHLKSIIIDFIGG